MRFKINDKGEKEEIIMPHVTPEMLILCELREIKEELQNINNKIDALREEKHNYCPNCGAKMVEPQESEE